MCLPPALDIKTGGHSLDERRAQPFSCEKPCELRHPSLHSALTETGNLAAHCVIHVWRIYVQLREGGSCGTIDMKIRFTSPNPGLKLKGVNYKRNKTGLLFNFSGDRAPALRLIELGGHQSNTSASAESIRTDSQTHRCLSVLSRQLSFINTGLYLFHSVWGDAVLNMTPNDFTALALVQFGRKHHKMRLNGVNKQLLILHMTLLMES